MKVAIGQINTTIGDFEGNLGKIRSFSQSAAEKGADLIIFPELTITGYPPLDFLENESFVKKNIEYAKKAASLSDKIDIIFGFVSRNRERKGKKVMNSAAYCTGGAIKRVVGKTLLPTYDVFDEGRYFEPASGNRAFKIKNMRCGLTICEDIWNDKDFWQRLPYRRDPVGDLVKDKVELIINISASPFTVEKFEQRLRILQHITKKNRLPAVYVNLVGGNDSLIFDGRSVAMGADGNLAYLCAAFNEDLAIVDIKKLKIPTTAEVETYERSVESEIVSALSLGLRDYVQKTGFEKVIIGLSGGVDSSVTAAIAVNALGPRNVISVMMPSRFSSEMSLRDAKKLALNLGIEHFVLPIDPIYEVFLSSLGPVLGSDLKGVTYENIQARIRGLLLMAFSNELGALVLNTGNKSELATGYCTLYGDTIGGLGILSDLTKENVYALARFFNEEREVIPASIIERPPSAELREGQKDEDTLPPYPLLDNIVKLYIEDLVDLNSIEYSGYDRGIAAKVIGMILTSEYKRRQAPMGLKVSDKAFGSGRRIPIAHRFREE